MDRMLRPILYILFILSNIFVLPTAFPVCSLFIQRVFVLIRRQRSAR